jgi:hypothetical protein
MLAGKQTFPGQDVSEVLAGVIKSDPDWDALPSDLPRSAHLVLRRCLTRDVDERLHSAADARILLQEARHEISDDGEAIARRIGGFQRRFRHGAETRVGKEWNRRNAHHPGPRYHLPFPVTRWGAACGDPQRPDLDRGVDRGPADATDATRYEFRSAVLAGRKVRGLRVLST